MRILFKITIRTIRENPIYARVSPPVTIDTPSKIIIKMTPMLPIASSFTLMTTPLLQNWLGTWTRDSLDQRIAKLEAQLANLEQIPEMDAVQNQILWEILIITPTGYIKMRVTMLRIKPHVPKSCGSHFMLSSCANCAALYD